MSAPIHSTDPILFQADRPFQFFLYDDLERLILFEGRVGNPGIPEGSMATNPHKHADDFYQNTFGTAVQMPPTAEEVGVEETQEEEAPVADAEVATSKTEELGKEAQETAAVAAPAPVAEPSSALKKSISRTLVYVST